MPTSAEGDEGRNRSLASALSACTSRLASGVRAYVCVKRRLLVRAQTLRYIPDFWIFHLPLGQGVSQAILLSGFLCQRSHGSPGKDPPPAFPAAIPLANGNSPSFPLPSNCCQQQKKELVSLEWCGGQICDTCFYLMTRQQLGKLTLQAERVESNLGRYCFSSNKRCITFLIDYFRCF